jgi:hypothetical protein
VIDARARLFGRGLLRARIAVPIKPGPLEARVDGKLGPMSFTAANRFLLVSNGIRITSGRTQGADIWFQVLNGQAVGELRLAYDGLDLELVDPITRKQSLGKKLKTLMASLLLRGSNKPDKHGHVPPGQIRYEVKPSDTFWGILWQASRSGLMRTLKK